MQGISPSVMTGTLFKNQTKISQCQIGLRLELNMLSFGIFMLPYSQQKAKGSVTSGNARRQPGRVPPTA